MRIDLRLRVTMAALLLVMMPFVQAPADPAAGPDGTDAGPAVEAGAGASADDRDGQSAEGGDETVPAEPFIPSESISADSAVSFPVDI